MHGQRTRSTAKRMDGCYKQMPPRYPHVLKRGVYLRYMYIYVVTRVSCEANVHVHMCTCSAFLHTLLGVHVHVHTVYMA